MKKFSIVSILIVCWVAVSMHLIPFPLAYAANPLIVKGPITDVDQYNYCHRCGMAVHKSEAAITVTGVPGEPWYQCCPMCAMLDVIETGNGNGTIEAYGHLSHEKSQWVIEDKALTTLTPPHAVVLVGGSCMKNLFFSSKAQALKFVTATPWATEKMIKPISKVFNNLAQKKKSFDHCSVCSTKMAGHENTLFSVLTKDKKRIVACCGHCGLFMSSKLGDKIKRGFTTDFKTGKRIDSEKAYYVVNNKMVLCCFPSTISFAHEKDAQNFQKEHGGEIMSFKQALGNIKMVMKGEK